MLNQVITAGFEDHLLVVDVSWARDLSERGSVTAELVGMDDLWNIVLTQESGQEDLCGVGVAAPVEKDAQHEAVLVHCAP